jgi:hypothetical protein
MLYFGTIRKCNNGPNGRELEEPRKVRKRDFVPLIVNISMTSPHFYIEDKRRLIMIGVAFNKRSVTSPFRGSKGAPTYSRDGLYSGLRAIVSETSTEPGQYFLPSAETIYKQFRRGRHQKSDIVNLGNVAKGLWVGNLDAKYVMLYFHGMF